MIFCLILGLLLIGFTLHCYLKNEPDDYFIHSQKPVPKDVFYDQFTVLHNLTYTLIPIASGSFLGVGFIILDYRRKKI
jgi:hypothetical protein